MYIYLITNLVNNKKYVGQTINDPLKRWTAHKSKTKSGSDFAINNALRKYGVENFQFEVIDDTNENIDQLNESEIKWIAYYDTYDGVGYNMTSGGDNYIRSEETRNKISEALKGEKHHFYGKKFSDETKEKMRQATLGMKHTEESIKKMSGENHHNYGKTHSEEWKKKMSERMSGSNHPLYGKPRSDETKEKLRQANLGKKHSDETKEKMRNLVISDETKLKISESLKGRIVSEETKEKLRNNSLCKKVLELNITGVLIHEYKSITEAVKCGKIPRTTLIRALKKKSGLNLAHNRLWRYKSDFTEEQYQQIINTLT